MKKYPTSKELLEACGGDKIEACILASKNIIEILKVLEDNIDNLSPDIEEKLNEIDNKLNEIIKLEKTYNTTT